ncbi:MAG: hypothetical protein JWP97_3865 [Labilithrix sp.]|nr:hypothetical protein [Labilithrix sp.]
MTSVRLLGLALVTAATLAALGACGSDEAPGVGPDGGTSSGDGGGGGDAGVPPTRAEFGLDVRPSNATCRSPERPPSTAPVKWDRVFAGATLNQPIMIAQIPGDSSRWFVAQRGGSIVSFPTANPAQVTTVLPSLGAIASRPGVPPTTVDTDGEGGLLGFAFHPKFAQNGKLYVTWTMKGGGPVGMESTVGVLHSPDNGASFDSYKTVVEPFPQPFTNHDGGGITFGKDGLLYLSFGDGGDGDDTAHHGQNKDTMFAKILRIDVDNVDSGKGYGIPATNPFKNGGGEPATFAYGFRNPFRFSIDRESNEVWVGDVGQNRFEEIDAKVKNGGNYGWPCREGLHDSANATDTGKCPGGTGTPTIDPIAEYEHAAPLGTALAITGGVVYRGKAIPDFVGSYVYADEVKGAMFTLSLDPSTGAAKTEQLADAPALTWVDFAEDNDGEVYAVALVQGQIYKLNAAAPATASTFPDRLSKTGCFDAADPKKPAPGLVPYGVSSPLWSDGAAKDRWLALPDGKTITVDPASGDFDFPNGTVLLKTFSLGGKPIETRMFTRHEDGGWAGYTYEWLDDGSDAVFLKSSKVKTIGAQTWSYPSRSDCVNCHNEASGRSLGLELGQQNSDYVYASTNRVANQLKTLDHIGLFDKPLPLPVDQLVAFPDPTGTAGTPETRARAYLHANCSNCHRPDGGGRGNMDLRFGTGVPDTKTCNVTNEAGNVNGASKLLVPGHPEQSLVSVRPHSPAANRMPPLASSVVDNGGMKVVDEWITSLTKCP